MNRRLTLQNLYKYLNHILKNQFIFLLITVSCANNRRNNVSRINTFFTDLDVRKMSVFTPENEKKTQDERNVIFVEELKLLGATDHQIRSALVVFNSPECVEKDKCISLIRETLLKTARYQDFTQRLILEVQPDKKIQIFRDHLSIPEEVRKIYTQIFDNQNNLELIRYRADLYLKFIHRALMENGKLNSYFPIPEMAVAFEKLEQEFLLLREAVNVNPEGIKSFIRRFGFDEIEDIEFIFNQFEENIYFVNHRYKEILLKIKDKDWNGLEYLDLMSFYIDFYAALNFSSMDSGREYSSEYWDKTYTLINKGNMFLITINSSRRGSYRSLGDLIDVGHIGLISANDLFEWDIFLTHAAEPLFNLIAPGYFMMSYDLATRYTNVFNSHDFTHAKDNSRDNIKTIFMRGGSREEVLQAVKEEIERRFENARHLEFFKQKFTQHDKEIINILLFEHFHERQKSNFLEDIKALGIMIKKFLDEPKNSLHIIEKYHLIAEEVTHLQLKLREFIKRDPYIFEENLQEISHFFAEYSH